MVQQGEVQNPTQMAVTLRFQQYLQVAEVLVGVAAAVYQAVLVVAVDIQLAPEVLAILVVIHQLRVTQAVLVEVTPMAVVVAVQVL
jgi:hypothetical protein